MEEFFAYVCDHAHAAPWILFVLLLLAGLNIPLSEDLIIITGGAIASTCIPDHTTKFYLYMYFGAIFSAWECYWLGRLLGPRLYTIRLFRSVVTPKRLERLRHYYAKYGLLTFIVGRFCPGGVRNALFLSSGLTKMPFHHFILRDSFAALLSSATLFFIGYHFGKNFDTLVYYFKRYEHGILAGVGLVVLAGLSYFLYTRFWSKRI
jgi:membrane protein DedA with SNARE-associated domain